MTGLEFRNVLLTDYDEFESGYFNDTQLQRFVNIATGSAFEERIRHYEETGLVGNDLLPFLKSATLVPGAGNVVDVSPTSASVPNYRAFQAGVATYVVSGKTYANRRLTPMKDEQKGSHYGVGSYMYPVYEKENNQLPIKPASPVCTSVTIKYIRTFIVIDITNNVTAIPYTQKFIDDIIRYAKAEMLATDENPQAQAQNMQNIQLNKQ